VSKVSTKSLSKVLHQLGLELNTTFLDVNEIEHAVAKAYSTDVALKGHSIKGLQRIDSVAQTLRALSHFTQELSKALPSDPKIDVGSTTSSITLSDLAKRLRDCSGPAATKEVSLQDIDLF
jgi:hypothetical protein